MSDKARETATRWLKIIRDGSPEMDGVWANNMACNALDELAALSQPAPAVEAVEALEEIASQTGPNDCEGAHWRADRARKALASLRERPTDEWVLVPKEPTFEMLEAGWVAYRDSTKPAPFNQLADGFRAMLAAAPPSSSTGEVG
jgi:hypothetical protein